MRSFRHWARQHVLPMLARGRHMLVLGATLAFAAGLELVRVLRPVLKVLVTETRAAWAWLTPAVRKALIIAAGLWLLASLLAAWKDVPGHWYETSFTNKRPLAQARSWFYHLSSLDLGRIAASDADLLVIDYAKGEDLTPLTREEVAAAKRKKDGKPRLAVSYFSIGEAESYRFYWRKEWGEDDVPGWHVAENCAWPRNHMVRFWHDGWKDIMFRGRKSYLKRIIDAGFDGVYLDRIDIYWELIKERPTARDDMIQFVTELAATARKLKPGFIVIAQNAEDLLSEKRYRDVIDGLGKEDLLYGIHGTGQRNPQKEIDAHLKDIRHLLGDWKPVFAVEYLPKAELIASARKELTGLGLVPTFAHRSLDGGDPTVERPPSTMPYGTAEWTKEKCQGKPHW